MPENTNPYGARSNPDDPYGTKPTVPMFPQDFGPTQGFGAYQPPYGHLDDEQRRYGRDPLLALHGVPPVGSKIPMYPGQDEAQEEVTVDPHAKLQALRQQVRDLTPEQRTMILTRGLRYVALPATLAVVQLVAAKRHPELRGYLLFTAAYNITGNAIILREFAAIGKANRG